VLFPGFIPDDDLPLVYSAATVFVFPSLYEGFGLPPLEAMACGCPVICSDRGALPEVVGEAALIAAPEPGPLAAALQKLWGDAKLRSVLREKGLKRAAEFSWEKTAREHLAVYQSL
jgi:glycosyltransferase involved in cell wall biosynthesis